MHRNIKPFLAAAAVATALLPGCKPPQPDDTAQAPDTDTVTAPLPADTAPADAAADLSPPPSAQPPARDTTVVDTVIDEVRLSARGDTEQNTLGVPTSTFDPKDSVYAEVTSNGTANAYTIYAKWIGADGTTLADYGIRVNEAGPKRTVISLSKPDGWPRGENRIELAVNGRVLRTVSFRVE